MVVVIDKWSPFGGGRKLRFDYTCTKWHGFTLRSEVGGEVAKLA
jgi:hypothetical protein